MDEEVEGLAITLTPVQLAAFLDGHEVPESASFSNRLWGTAALVGSIVELAGAGVMCVLPEPTMLSKAGCVIVGAHGLDSMVASGRQVWTGQSQRSITSQAASKLAMELGASPHGAEAIALAVDVAVPLAVSAGLGAVRVIAVRRGGAIVLAEHEAAAGTRLGGHTIEMHVGWSDAQLMARANAAMKSGRRGPQMVSTFNDLRIAEQAIGATFRSNSGAIRAWARSAGPGAKTAFSHSYGKVIGRGVQAGSPTVSQLSNVRVVLKMESYNGKVFYILTAYPA